MCFCALCRNGWKGIFAKKSPVDSAYILWDKKFHRNPTIMHCFRGKCFKRFTQKFKMAAKSGGNVIFVKSHQYTLDTLGVKNFENSKWPPFLGRRKFFLNCQEYNVQIPCGLKILTKSLYLARLRR